MTLLHAAKTLVKAMNNIFIGIVLFVFYFTGIGLGFLIRRLFHPGIRSESDWLLPDKEGPHLRSPY